MNWYEQKQQEKKERYETIAEACRKRAERLSSEGWKSLEAIPFGQPILAGHYSEKSDRSYRNRAVNKIDKSVEESKKADYYENRAENMSNAISSDDPDAVEKLKIKLAKLEDWHKNMKEENAEAKALNVEKPHPAWQLSNNNAVIRSVKQRIEQLEKKQNMIVNEDVIGLGWVLHEEKEQNRIQFLFEAIPSVEIRTELKSRGFRWSPMNKAWQRQLNTQGRWSAEYIKIKLER